MKQHRFIGNFSFEKDTIEIHDPDLAHQLKRVLRLEKGEVVVLCDGAGNEAVVRLLGISDSVVLGKITERMRNNREISRAVTLYCALLKRENFELVVEKATEIGVHTIIPIKTSRTVKLQLNHDRMRKIAKEAAEQSGRGIIPIISEVTFFNEALKNIPSQEKEVLFHVSQGVFDPSVYAHASYLGIWIGPEGGWSDTELQAAKDKGFFIAGLGKTILRAETAAIIASYMVCSV